MTETLNTVASPSSFAVPGEKTSLAFGGTFTRNAIVAGVGAKIDSRSSKLPSLMFQTRASGVQRLPEPVGIDHCTTVALVRSAMLVVIFFDSAPRSWNASGILRQCDASAHVPRWRLGIVTRAPSSASMR